jgi:hypothetical protein
MHINKNIEYIPEFPDMSTDEYENGKVTFLYTF